MCLFLCVSYSHLNCKTHFVQKWVIACKLNEISVDLMSWLKKSRCGSLSPVRPSQTTASLHIKKELNTKKSYGNLENSCEWNLWILSSLLVILTTQWAWALSPSQFAIHRISCYSMRHRKPHKQPTTTKTAIIIQSNCDWMVFFLSSQSHVISFLFKKKGNHVLESSHQLNERRKKVEECREPWSRNRLVKISKWCCWQTHVVLQFGPQCQRAMLWRRIFATIGASVTKTNTPIECITNHSLCTCVRFHLCCALLLCRLRNC